MAADAILSQELNSLKEEISASKRESPATSPPGAPPESAAETRQDREQLRQFVDELSKLVEEGGKSISAHPVASLAGALVVGILIGRLLGRR